MKIIIIIAFLGLLQGCGGFQAKRVGAKESDEKALTITNKWLAADTEQVVKELSQKIEKHRGFRKYLRGAGKTPAVFISDVKNLTSDSNFPINDINDEEIKQEEINEEKKAPKKSPTAKLKDEIKSLQSEAENQSDRYLRLKAEFDNYRRRKHDETTNLLKYDGEAVIKQFLSVLPNHNFETFNRDNRKSVFSPLENL